MKKIVKNKQIKNYLNPNWDLVITPNRGWFDLDLKDILRYRDLLWIFVKRDFSTFYKQTILGPLWFFIQPFLSTFVFFIIFNKVAGISTDTVPPLLFYMSGIITWNYFSSCFNSTSNTFTANAGLFSKVYFPRIIVPISIIISGLSRFFVQLLLFLIFYLFYFFTDNGNINPSFISIFFLFPVLIIQMAMLGQGMGMIISSLTTKYRDLSYLVSFGTQLMMYATTVIYPLSSVPDKYKLFIILNPMTSVIEGFRYTFIGNSKFDYNILFYSMSLTLIVFFLGLIIFNKVEKTFIDTV